MLTLWGGVFFSFEVLIRVGSHLSTSRSSLRLAGHLSQILANHRSEKGTFERILAQSTTLGMIHNSRLELQNNLKQSFVDAVSMSRSSKAPAFIAYLLCAIYTLTSEDSDKLGIGSYTRTLEIKESVRKELQKLELIVNQLEGDRHTASPGIPNIDRMRKWIEHYTLQGSSNGCYGQGVVDSLKFASAQEMCLYCQSHEPESSSADLPHVTDLFQRHSVSSLSDERLRGRISEPETL